MLSDPNEYRRNPGRCGSLAHWKQRTMSDLSGIREIHADDDQHPDAPERYFKLTHSLTDIPAARLEPPLRFTTLSAATDAERIARVINASYPAIRVAADEVRSWAQRPVHAPQLWIGAETGSELTGCAITDHDPLVGEASLDWVQVLPQWRGHGIATALVLETLHRAATMAEFATVSGDLDNETAPERVYRRCGFTGHDTWHIYRH